MELKERIVVPSGHYWCERVIEKTKEGYALYTINNGTKRKHKNGEFKVIDGVLHFQFAGKKFKMSGNKRSYESACKRIDMENGTWIAINKDRVARECEVEPSYLLAAKIVIKSITDDEVHKLLSK